VLFPELDGLFSFFRNLNFGDSESWVIKRLNSVIQARKQIVKEFKSVDILQVLLEQNKKLEEQDGVQYKKENEPDSGKIWKLSDNAIEANVYAFLLAGYETTSTALGFTSWLLAKHQDVQRKLQQEIDETIKSGESINYEVVRKMPYMDAVFKESLRYYPPVTQLFTSRLCTTECVVQGIKFVPGVNAMFLPQVIHHDPEIWPEPERFHPDRFLNAKDFHPMAWMPFGHGPRNCIGMRFADMECKLCLFQLLSKYNIEFGLSSEDPLIVDEREVLMCPKNGVFVKLTKRTN
jgi:cytochrome P450 family 3 subfamily A